MKVLMLWKYYPQYLSFFYEKYPHVIDLPFEDHRNKILDDHSGWPGDLSRHMNEHGIETEFIIVNAESMQKAWARENDFKSYSKNGWEKEIAMEQIKQFQPDVLWIPSIFDYFGTFVNNALPYCKKAITWVSCALPANLDVSGFTDMVTSHPDMLKDKQHLFNNVIVIKSGFDSSILEKIGPVKKKYDISFIGGITPDHSKRAETLAFLIENGIDLKVFGYFYESPSIGTWNFLKQAGKYVSSLQKIRRGIDAFRHTYVQTNYQHNIEIIKKVHQGPVFGLEMYRTLAASRISLNIHIDAAEDYAGNIRLFETTGIGTCLLTEQFENITYLFEPNKEILTYHSKEELLDIIKKMLDQKDKIEAIAKAGQERTLKDHTIGRMFNDIKHVFDILDE